MINILGIPLSGTFYLSFKKISRISKMHSMPPREAKTYQVKDGNQQ
jgi:hypothetical protein